MNPENKIRMSIKIKQPHGRETIFKTNYIYLSQINNIPLDCVNNRLEEFMTLMMHLPNEFLLQGFSIIAMKSFSRILVADNKISINWNNTLQTRLIIKSLAGEIIRNCRTQKYILYHTNFKCNKDNILTDYFIGQTHNLLGQA